MDACLAATGSDAALIIGIAIGLTLIGLIGLARKTRAVLWIVALFMVAALPLTSSDVSRAAAPCGSLPIASTVNDFRTTGYTLGMSISIDILANDPGSAGADRSTIDLKPDTNGIQSATTSAHGSWQLQSGTGMVMFSPTGPTSSSGDTIQYQYRYTDGTLSRITDVTVVATSTTPPAAPIAHDDYLEEFCYFNDSLMQVFIVTVNDCSNHTYQPMKTTWTTKLLTLNDTISSPATYDFASVDINSAVPGIQQTFSGSGFTASYNPANDTLAVSITNRTAYQAYLNAQTGTDFSFTPECEDYNDRVFSDSSATMCNSSGANDTVLQYEFKDSYGSASNSATVRHRGIYVQGIIT